MSSFTASEISLTIDIKFTISMECYEIDRIAYHNLKNKLSLNALSDDEMSDLWTPYFIYSNTDDNEATKVNHKFKNIKTTVAVTREGAVTRAKMDSVDDIELFKAAFSIAFAIYIFGSLISKKHFRMHNFI